MKKESGEKMHIIDLHCDVLYKLWRAKGGLNFFNAQELDVNMLNMEEGDVKVQCFAIFVPPDVKVEEKFHVALEQAMYFHTEIIEKYPHIKHIRTWSDFFQMNSSDVGAILSLEGVDCIGDDLLKLGMLQQLGVMSVGLTWNHANLAADGIEEKRGAGLTKLGERVVQFNNKQKLLTDVSHLSEKAFWDVVQIAEYPIASHSNAQAVCNHPRNLTDEQAKALFALNAMVHIVYYPPFITFKEQATISDLLQHLDHFCALGGVKHVGLGSDFDGISSHVKHLEHAGKHQNLINTLLKYYSEEEVRGFASENFLQHYPAKLM